MTWSYLYAVIGIPVILILGGVGVVVPPILAYFLPTFSITKQYYFTFFNGLAAGLIIAVAFVHSLADGSGSFDNIVSILYDTSSSEAPSNFSSSSLMGNFSSASTSSSGPDGPATYAWFGFIAMMGALFTFLSEEIVDSISEIFGIWNPHGHGHGGHSHGTALDSVAGEGCDEVIATDSPEVQGELEREPKSDEEISEEKKAKELNEGYVKPISKMLILFTGLIFHNIFVGIALGVESSLELFLAIIFHQFFEGLGMGARIALAKLKRILVILIIDTVFALACPFGIVIGIIIRIKTSADSLTFYAIDGTFQSLSGGILIYISVMHMLKAYVETESKGKVLQLHKWISFAGVLVGATIMAVIGIWA